MSTKLRGLLAVLFAAALLALWGRAVSGGAPGGRAGAAFEGQITPTPLPIPTAAPRPAPGENGLAPSINPIDASTPQCYRPEPYTNRCYIQWNYQQVSASAPNYIISMTVSIDNRMRAYYSGFFQTSLYVPQEMTGPGFLVACGLPGAGGAGSNLGNTYPWNIQARETGGLATQSSGRVSCPADVVPAAPLDLNGPTSGLTRVPYSFTISASPNASLPITYTWTVSGQAGLTVTNGLSNTQAFAWPAPGLQHLLIEIANPAGVITTTRTILILPHTIYLPLAANMVK